MNPNLICFCFRKRTLMVNNLIAITSGILLFLTKEANSVALLIIGRILIGLNCGEAETYWYCILRQTGILPNEQPTVKYYENAPSYNGLNSISIDSNAPSLTEMWIVPSLAYDILWHIIFVQEPNRARIATGAMNKKWNSRRRLQKHAEEVLRERYKRKLEQHAVLVIVTFYAEHAILSPILCSRHTLLHRKKSSVVPL